MAAQLLWTIATARFCRVEYIASEVADAALPRVPTCEGRAEKSSASLPVWGAPDVTRAGRICGMIDDAAALPFDSPRWDELETRRGAGAGWVRDFLVTASNGPLGSEAFTDVWPGVCSEGTTYDAAYASAPYLVAIAERLPASKSIEYVMVLGLIETYAGEVPPDLERGYRKAMRDARALALARLADCPIDHSLRYLLAAVAAFRGRRDLAAVLQELDTIEGTCASCGSAVFPAELQQVTGNDETTNEG